MSTRRTPQAFVLGEEKEDAEFAEKPGTVRMETAKRTARVSSPPVDQSVSTRTIETLAPPKELGPAPLVQAQPMSSRLVAPVSATTAKSATVVERPLIIEPMRILQTPAATVDTLIVPGAARKPRAVAIEDVELAPDEPVTTTDVELPRTIDRAAPRRFAWGGVLLSALTTLFMLGIGLWATKIVEGFFARSTILGWFALGVASLAALAALVIIAREIWSIYRLDKLEMLQEKAGRAITLDDRLAAKETVEGLLSLYGARSDMRWHVDKLKSHSSDIMDAKDRVHLAERTLLEPLDEEATRIIAKRARRVTLLTTVTPMAALDILFVGAQNLAMLREIATLYGGKPSAITTWKLARMVVTHLAVAGGLALSDTFLQHLVGKGLLGRLSARFGEGAVNGIMTSRIGLAAAAVCRPVPKGSGTTETLTGLLKAVLDFGDREKG